MSDSVLHSASSSSSPIKKRMKTIPTSPVVIKQEPVDHSKQSAVESEKGEEATIVKKEKEDEHDSSTKKVKIESLDALIGAKDVYGTKRTPPKRKRMSDLATKSPSSSFSGESGKKRESDGNVKMNSVKQEAGASAKKKTSVKKEARVKEENSIKKEGVTRKPRAKVVKTEEVLETVEDLVDEFETKAPKRSKNKKAKGEESSTPRKKKNPYGLSPGVSPFPDFKMPTPEAAREVSRLLSQAHGAVHAPATLQPSLNVSGCGEVPCVLDALVRTLLSAATTNKNSSTAFQGLVKRFGTYKSGVGKGSVNWNNVREAAVEDVEEAIRSGGLAKAKSKNIKKILDIVYETNKARREALLEEKKTGQTADIVGSTIETQKQKNKEIESADSHVLSLQYVHELSTEDAMMELLKMPGVGVKVSSCVILFCLRRPSFAVDTHVWRLCKWLKWVPPKATRDQTFSHCEIRVPNELKYGLHKLLIRHGRTCPKCRAAVSSKNEAWANTKCPIEHLVTRTGARKAA